GVVVDAAGYVLFFAYASVLGAPAVILILVLARLERRGVIRRKRESAHPPDTGPEPAADSPKSVPGTS
ncbi:MAG: hypothetical protein OXF57_06535, partial [Rhodospirillaceae bacterium]|nr:hypothetical protein [Rhodospirillaceae bacterium]